MSLDAGRISGLARTKLEGLVRRAFPDVTASAEAFNAGVGLADAGRAFVMLIESAPSPMAAALAWGAKHDATELHVIADDPDLMVTLAAQGLDPVPTVWRTSGTDLVRMEDPAPVANTEPPPAVLAQVPVLEAAGCDVVVEHGVVIGEVLGLEVARVALEADGSSVVRVGVGLYDQEAHALVHARSSVQERLDQVSSEVRSHRSAAAGPHPLNRVARERWLRSLACADPGLLGLDVLSPLPPPVPRGGIHEQRPVAASGRRGDAAVLAVFSSGIDLDLVPVAAAHLGLAGPETFGEVALVLPERDHHDVIRRMADALARPWSLASIADPWP